MKPPIPFGEVENGNVEAAVGGPVEGGGHICLITQKGTL
jgi:hypothetical protein